jgi:hypothetical protein
MTSQTTEIGEWEKPDSQDVDRVILAIANPEIARVFFGELENPLWMEPLHLKGYFKEAPNREYRDDGSYRFPIWAEGSYLLRISTVVPDRVAEILKNFQDKGHPGAQSIILEMATRMPSSNAAIMTPKIVDFLRADEGAYLDPRALLRLVSVLVEGGSPTRGALNKLLNAMFQPRPSTGVEVADGFPYEPVSGLDNYWYQEILPEAIDILLVVDGVDVLRTLTSWFRDLDRVMGNGVEGDHSTHVWRPSIGPHAQNGNHSFADPLVSVTRDVAIRIIDENSESLVAVISALEDLSTPLAHRISHHLLARSIEKNIPGAIEMGTERLLDAMFLDETFRHEYAELARAVLAVNPDEVAQLWLRLVEGDPLASDETLKAFLAFANDKDVAEVTPDELANLRKWRLRELLACAEPALSGTLADKLAALDHDLGSRGEKPPDFPFWMHSLSGPSTPIGQEELSEMTPKQLISYLETWRPTDNLFQEPSREGLGWQLTAAIRINPNLLGGYIDRLSELHPTYVGFVIRGWDAAIKDGLPLPWDGIVSVLTLIADPAREQPHLEAGEDGHDWRWTSQSLASFIRTSLLSSEELRPPLSLRSQIWEVIKHLTESDDPTPERETGGDGTSWDPLNFSLNVVRGQAMGAVIAYLSWLVTAGLVTAGTMSREDAPEVWEVLDRHLDAAVDPSAAIRATYGQDFPFLATISPDWARANVDRLFGIVSDDVEEQRRRDAAWSAFVTVHNPNHTSFDFLQSIYLERIRSRTSSVPPPKGTNLSLFNRTAEHILILYIRGLIEIDSGDGLLAEFVESSTSEERSEILDHLGWLIYSQRDGFDGPTVERLQILWEWRSRAAEDANDVRELSGFGWWFRSGLFSRVWAISSMALAAHQTSFVKGAGLICQELLKYAEDFPQLSLEVLDRLLLNAGDRSFSSIFDFAPQVLALALNAAEDEVAPKAEKIMEALGRSGDLDIRERVQAARLGVTITVDLDDDTR